MFGTLRGRIGVILFATALAVYTLMANPVKQGLDLQGGMHLALEVRDPDNTMTADARRDATDRSLYVIRNRIDQFGVAEPLVQKVGDDRIIVELPGIRDEDRAKAIIEQQAFLEWKLVRPLSELQNVMRRIDGAVAAQLGPADLRETPGQPADTSTGAQRSVRDLVLGISRDTTQRDTTAADSARADSAQADTLAATPGQRPLSSLLVPSGSEGEILVAAQDVDRVQRYLDLPGVRDLLPRNSQLLWASDTVAQGAQLYRQLYFLADDPFITGESLREATAGRDPQFNETIVTFQLDRRGGRVFERVTSDHIGDRIAIVLDDQVHSAPVVESRIGASGQIQMGQAPMQEASDLALVLRAGALPAPLDIVEQRSVGPSLGQDSIEKGRIAGMLGVLAVIAIMVFVYKFSGFLAVAALAFYVLFLLAGLAGLGAALTAPGIAGFILSLGMAVDANVLIYERIREELEAGRSQRAAVDAGFENALSAIVDSNLTTLITALILYRVGTGPVQGFATTLGIGIIASFFTAVYITRTLFMLYLARKRPAAPISI
jgi:preprotein translocase subunit SecD